MCDRARHQVARVSRLALLFAAVSACGSSVSAQSADPDERLLLGTWQLDPAQSRYFPGPAPRSETRVYTEVGGEIHGVITRTYPDGRAETIEYTANAGREQAVTGTPAYDAITLTKAGNRTWVSTLSHAGMVFGTARRVISEDGRTMTITFERKTTGETVRNVAVYRRQAGP